MTSARFNPMASTLRRTSFHAGCRVGRLSIFSTSADPVHEFVLLWAYSLPRLKSDDELAVDLITVHQSMGLLHVVERQHLRGLRCVAAVRHPIDDALHRDL